MLRAWLSVLSALLSGSMRQHDTGRKRRSRVWRFRLGRKSYFWRYSPFNVGTPHHTSKCSWEPIWKGWGVSTWRPEGLTPNPDTLWDSSLQKAHTLTHCQAVICPLLELVALYQSYICCSCDVLRVSYAVITLSWGTIFFFELLRGLHAVQVP